MSDGTISINSGLTTIDARIRIVPLHRMRCLRQALPVKPMAENCSQHGCRHCDLLVLWCYLDQCHDMHSIQEVVDSNHAWWMHQPSQVLLWVAGPEYLHGRYDSRDADEGCLELARLENARLFAARHFRSWATVCRPTFTWNGFRLILSRALIFDIVRLATLIELPQKGMDVTCRFSQGQ